MQLLTFLIWTSAVAVSSSSAKRNIQIKGHDFVDSMGSKIVLAGPNVVVKAAPYLPNVEGSSYCNDDTGDLCKAHGNCTTCTTFNQADVDHIKSLGWNFIRLGVVWAGAQPRDEDKLDEDFVRRLHAVLDLTDKNGIHVMLDNHGDMVGTAGCGNGVPMWIQQKAAPELIGKPLHTDFPYSLVSKINVKKTSGYDHCGENETLWAQHAGDPNYNLLNECCLAMNSGNPGGLGFTTISQKTMDYILKPGEGRNYFVRYWRLVAEAVVDHPSAFAFELMNEPMSIRRKWMFDTWRACAESIHQVIPDASVSIADVGEGTVFPGWITQYTGGFEDISSDTEKYIKDENRLFYAWHYGTMPKGMNNMLEISQKWNVPIFGTETSCDQFDYSKSVNISHSYWHYSCYCNTGPWFGNRKVPEDTFGGCLLGWDGGNSAGCV